MLCVITLVTLLGQCLSTPVTPVFHAGEGRQIRPLHCVSKATQETGVCMFAWNCLKANGTHLGTCIDRFYFGSCCKIKDGQPLLQETEKPVKTTEAETNHNSIEQNAPQVGIWPVDKFPTGPVVTSAKPVYGTISIGTQVPVKEQDSDSTLTTKEPTFPTSGSTQKSTTSKVSSSISLTTTVPSIASQSTVMSDKPSTTSKLTSSESISTPVPISSTPAPIVNLSTAPPTVTQTEGTTIAANTPLSILTSSTSPVQPTSVDKINVTLSAEIPPNSQPIPVVVIVQSSVPTEPISTTLTPSSQSTNTPTTAAISTTQLIITTEKAVIGGADKSPVPAVETNFTNAHPVHVDINVQSSLSPSETTVSSVVGDEEVTMTEELNPADDEFSAVSTELIPSIDINVTDTEDEEDTTIASQTPDGVKETVFFTITEAPDAVVTTSMAEILSTIEPIVAGEVVSVSTTQKNGTEEVSVIKTEAPVVPELGVETTVSPSSVEQSSKEPATTTETSETEIEVKTTTVPSALDEKNETGIMTDIDMTVILPGVNATQEVRNASTNAPVEGVNLNFNTSSTLPAHSSEAFTTEKVVLLSSTSSVAPSSAELSSTAASSSSPQPLTTPKVNVSASAGLPSSTSPPPQTTEKNVNTTTIETKVEEGLTAINVTSSTETPIDGESPTSAQEVSSTSVASSVPSEGPAAVTSPETTTPVPTTVVAANTTEQAVATLTLGSSSVTPEEKVTTTEVSTSAITETTTTIPTTTALLTTTTSSTSVIPTTTTSSTSTVPTTTTASTTTVATTTTSSTSTVLTTTTTSTVTTTTTAVTTVPEDVIEPFDPDSYKKICGRPVIPSGRIVNGQTASFGQWPWQISLRQWKTATFLHKCGAALLNENWAITAAHCVDNVQPEDILLRMGEYDLASENEPYNYTERRVQLVASHPKFDPRTFEYDLALLRFYEPVQFQPNIIPICIPEGEKDYVGSTGFVTGWGRLYEDGPLPSKLQQVEVPVISNSQCEGMYRAAGYVEHIPSSIFICAGYKEGKRDSCEGDSGGPMVLREGDHWVLGGVISWGIGCAEPNQPGVYTRITEFRNWINQIIVF